MWSPSRQRANGIGLRAPLGTTPRHGAPPCSPGSQRGVPGSAPPQRVCGSDSTLPPTQDLLKHTPPSHPDHPLLQDALRISQNFLSSINEEITPRRQSMTVKKGEVGAAAPALAGWTPAGGRGIRVGCWYVVASRWGCVLSLRHFCQMGVPSWGDGPEGRRHLSAWRLLSAPLTILSQ